MALLDRGMAMQASTNWEEEHTEEVPRIVRARRVGRVLVAGAGIAASLAAATWFAPRRAAADPRAAAVVRAQAVALARALDTTAGTAHARSDQLASDSLMRAAILTDAKTVADLVASKQFTLAPLAGETMELFQLDGDQVTSLVRTPPGAAPIRWMRGEGTRIENVGDGLNVVVSAEVERLKDGAGYKTTISGSLAISDPIALDAVRTQLAGIALSAVIEGAGKAPLVVLAPQPGTAGAALRENVHPNPEWFGDLTLSAIPRTRAVRPTWTAPVRDGGFAIAALLLIVRIAAGMRRTPERRADRPG